MSGSGDGRLPTFSPLAIDLRAALSPRASSSKCGVVWPNGSRVDFRAEGPKLDFDAHLQGS